MNDGYILFYDSGIGGLTTLRAAMELLPNERFLYYADNKNCPYGNRTKSEIQKLANEAINGLFLRYKIKLLVFACNTLTTCLIGTFRRRLKVDIVGTEPAVRLAAKNSKTKKILVVSTLATSRQEKFKVLCKSAGAEVTCLPLNDLALSIENWLAEGMPFDAKKYECTIKSALEKSGGADGLVLGCTHYCFLKREFKDELGVEVFDGNDGVARRIKALLCAKDALAPSRQQGGVKIITSLGKKYNQKYSKILQGIKNL